MSSNWLGLSSFGLGAAGMFATVYCTQAILPTLGREFGVGAARTGLTISVVVVAMAAGAWIWGPLSDRIGRKRCLVLSSGLLVAPTVALGLAPSFAVLLGCRLLQGLCMPGLLAVGLNYVQEVFGDWLGGKAMGCYLSSLVAGGLIGRVGVALATEVVGWRLSLAALAHTARRSGASHALRVTTVRFAGQGKARARGRHTPARKPRVAIGNAGRVRAIFLLRRCLYLRHLLPGGSSLLALSSSRKPHLLAVEFGGGGASSPGP